MAFIYSSLQQSGKLLQSCAGLSRGVEQPVFQSDRVRRVRESKLVDDVKLSMILGHGGATASRVGPVARCARTYSLPVYRPLLGLLFLDIIGEIRKGLDVWSGLANEASAITLAILTSSPFRRSCGVCFTRAAITSVELLLGEERGIKVSPPPSLRYSRDHCTGTIKKRVRYVKWFYLDIASAR